MFPDFPLDLKQVAIASSVPMPPGHHSAILFQCCEGQTGAVDPHHPGGEPQRYAVGGDLGVCGDEQVLGRFSFFLEGFGA